MNAIVFGNGRSGKAAAELLRRDGAFVRVLDGEDAWPKGEWDVCVASPGVPCDHPWQIAARVAGVRVVSELQLGAERFRSMGGRMLAVTGSKGKSSVVKLVADALEGIPCGNYGLPLCEVVLNCRLAGGRLPFAVVEVSSFQMETTHLPPDAFVAAAILNLQEDHLDRHGSVEAYHALKRKLLDFTPAGIIVGENGGAKEKAQIDRDVCLMSGSYFDNPVLRENGLCAVALMRAAGLGDEAIRSAFSRFVALPHRMQVVCEENGVAWIDDSKATSISALVAGVEMAVSRQLHVSLALGRCFRGVGGATGKVRLIAGGKPKGDDPLSAKECLARGVAKVYLIGQSAQEFASAWSDVVACEVCGTLEAAVDSARCDASEGDCVLLSPGTASFDQFASYSERGDRFADLACGRRKMV